jgi:hypothetical protein
VVILDEKASTKNASLPWPSPMSDSQDPRPTGPIPDAGQPPRSRLRRILDERPEARPRLGKAIAALLGTGLVTLAALGGLMIWHIMRRGRLIRERLSAPRIVRPLEPPDHEVDQSS